MLGACLAWQLAHVAHAALVDGASRPGVALVGRRRVLAQGLYAAAATVALLSPEAAVGALALVQLFRGVTATALAGLSPLTNQRGLALRTAGCGQLSAPGSDRLSQPYVPPGERFGERTGVYQRD